MNFVTSQDGTKIAYDQVGQGPALILVAGAFSYRKFPGQVCSWPICYPRTLRYTATIAEAAATAVTQKRMPPSGRLKIYTR